MINKHTYIPEDAQIFCDFKIGNFCSVASGFKIISGQHPAVHNPNCVSNFPFYEHLWGDYPPCHLNGKVVIENDVWIGQDVSIKEDVKIYNGAMIAANSVVTRDVLPFTMVAGNPAIFKYRRFNKIIIQKLLDISWWDWPDEKIKQALPDMVHVGYFVNKYWNNNDKGD